MARHKRPHPPDSATRRQVLKCGLYGGLAASLSSGLWLGGCGKDKSNKRPNIILISIDTLRADHLGCYGYDRNTTPYVDRFAGESILFTEALAPTPWTLPSHVAMLTGMHPFRIGMADRESKIPDAVPLVSELLHAEGYQTAAFVDSTPQGFLGGERGFSRGFDTYEHPPHKPEFNYVFDMEATVDASVAWLENRSKEKPFFLFVHTKAVHSVPSVIDGDARCFPYDKPEPFRERFLTQDQAALHWDPPYSLYLEHHNRLLANGKIESADFDPLRVASLVGQYDGSINYVDAQFGRFLERIDALGLSGDTVVIFTADHGEAFLEHAFFLHIELYRDLLRVPLIVRLPQDRTARAVNQPVELGAVAPTLLRLARIDIPDRIRALPLPITGRFKPDVQPFYSYYQYGSKAIYHAFSLRADPWKLIYHKPLIDGEWRFELFNIFDDPREIAPVQNRSDIEEGFKKRLLNWMALKPFADVETIVLDPETLEQLKALGY